MRAGIMAANVVVAAIALALAAVSDRASAQGEEFCSGDVTGGFPEPEPEGNRLLFGLYPGGRAGQIVGGPVAAKPEQPPKTLAALDELRGAKRLVVHLYLEFTNAQDQPSRVREAVRLIRRYARHGYEVEYVLPYRPRERRGKPDVRDFAAFARRMVRRLGRLEGLKAIQVTNEANNSFSPDASDGSYPGAREALVKGVIAAKRAADRRDLERLEIGFNWFYRTDPENENAFWTELGAKGGRRFARSVDWVGVDAYPGTYFPPPPLPRGDSILNAISALRECYMPLAGLGQKVPIHVTENGWPTGPGRSYEEQALALKEMVRAVHAYRANYNVTDYRWFDLRDADSASPNFQQQYGLVRDDYERKPAFDAYRGLIDRFGRR